MNAPETTPPNPIPASTTASITANAVEDEGHTSAETGTNHFQSEKDAARSKANEKQTPRWPIARFQTQRKCPLSDECTSVVGNSCGEQTIPAAVQTAKPAAKLVPRSPTQR